MCVYFLFIHIPRYVYTSVGGVYWDKSSVKCLFFPVLGYMMLGFGATELCSLVGKIIFTNQRSWRPKFSSYSM